MSSLSWHSPETIGVGLVIVLFFAFLIGHAVGDYPLQNEFMARGKNRHLPPVCPDAVPGLWVYCMTAHALTHAGIVWIISGCALLGAIEAVMHWLIDFLKMEKKISFLVDQALHVVCKAAYVAAIVIMSK
jgi:Protein of unknown function (DUF3307)